MWTEVVGGNKGTLTDGDAFGYFDDQLVFTGISGGSYHYDGEYCLRDVAFSFRNQVNNRNYTLPAKGNGQPHSNFQWAVPAGQRVISIALTFGRYVNTIQFTTDGGVISPVLGTGAGPQHTIINLNQTIIRGFGGRAGDVIDQLKFYLKI